MDPLLRAPLPLFSLEFHGATLQTSNARKTQQRAGPAVAASSLTLGPTAIGGAPAAAPASTPPPTALVTFSQRRTAGGRKVAEAPLSLTAPVVVLNWTAGFHEPTGGTLSAAYRSDNKLFLQLSPGPSPSPGRGLSGAMAAAAHRGRPCSRLLRWYADPARRPTSLALNDDGTVLAATTADGYVLLIPAYRLLLDGRLVLVRDGLTPAGLPSLVAYAKAKQRAKEEAAAAAVAAAAVGAGARAPPTGGAKGGKGGAPPSSPSAAPASSRTSETYEDAAAASRARARNRAAAAAAAATAAAAAAPSSSDADGGAHANVVVMMQVSLTPGGGGGGVPSSPHLRSQGSASSTPAGVSARAGSLQQLGGGSSSASRGSKTATSASASSSGAEFLKANDVPTVCVW